MAHVYNAQLDAFTIYHIALKEEIAPSVLSGPALPALGHALAGSIGTALSNLAVFPLDLIITRLQVQRLIRSGKGKGIEGVEQDVQYCSIPDAARQIYYQEGGIPAFYTGVVQDTAKSVADSFLFFLAYNFLRQRRLNGRISDKGSVVKSLPILEELAVGMLAGAFSKLFTTPIGNIVTRKQVDSMVASREHGSGTTSSELEKVEAATAQKPAARGSGKSVKDIAKDIYDTKGLKGFWSGYSATLVLTLNPAITFLLHNTLTRTLLPRSQRDAPGARATFLLAAVSKAVASTITYPFSLAKARSQADGKYESSKSRTVFGSLLGILREDGWKGLYDGVEGEVIKGFLANGLTMTLKEWVHRFVIQAYYIVLKLLRRYPVSEVAGNAKDVVANAGGAAKNAVIGASGTAKDAVLSAGGQANELAGRAGGVVTNATNQTKDAMAPMSAQVKDALVDLGDEVEEVAAAIGDGTSDTFYGIVETADGWRGKVVGFVRTKVVGSGEGQGGEGGGEGD